MRRIASRCWFCVSLVAVIVMPSAWAAPPEAPSDTQRLSAQLDKLDANPTLGKYAAAQRTLARDAIAELAQAGRRGHDHALFMAEQRVALAEGAATAAADRAQLDELQREHDQIMLEASQAEAAAARAELARQRLQYEAAVQHAQLLQQQGAQAAEQAQQAQAEAVQARKLAAAQARAATLARKQAELAEKARSLQSGSGGSAPAGAKIDNDLSLTKLSFQGDSGDLTAAGKRRVADFAKAHADQAIVITPSASSDSRVLAGRRAVSVREALAAAGADKVSIRSVASTDGGMRILIEAEP